MTLWKKVLVASYSALALNAVSGGAFDALPAAAFDASMEKDYSLPTLDIHTVSDPAVIARGKHVAEAITGCMGCLGADLRGKPGKTGLAAISEVGWNRLLDTGSSGTASRSRASCRSKRCAP